MPPDEAHVLLGTVREPLALFVENPRAELG
jgi:hypothetical protein